jgi:hypothetical protein
MDPDPDEIRVAFSENGVHSQSHAPSPSFFPSMYPYIAAIAHFWRDTSLNTVSHKKLSILFPTPVTNKED